MVYIINLTLIKKKFLYLCKLTSMYRRYLPYDKKLLFEKIDKLSIELVGSQVVTKFGNSVISTSNVSKRYEVFDIKSYLVSKINSIEDNFEIKEYFLNIRGGIQELVLLSDEIEIGGLKFRKSFFILNSSNRSRKLSFNAGLFSKDGDFYIISNVKNVGLSKKHLKGVTKAAEEAIENINDETFEDQVSMIQSLVGHKVSFSNLQKVIVGDSNVELDHLKFDAFKNQIIYLSSEDRIRLSEDNRRSLKTPSRSLTIDRSNDFHIDAFWSLQTYLKIFSNQDSHVIKKETEKISKITQLAIRNRSLESLGI